MISGDRWPWAYNTLVANLRAYGRSVSPRGLPTLETPTPASFLTDAHSTVLRKGMSVRLGILESLMIVGAELDLVKIQTIAPNTDIELWKRQSDYGPRLKEQVEDIILLLGKDPSSRRAVAYLNEPTTPREDFACSSSIQWLVRAGALETFVHLRSWDIVYGLPMDVITHSILSQAMARCLGYEVGHMSFNCPSLHLYEKTSNLALGTGHVTFALNEDWPSRGAPWHEYQDYARQSAALFAQTPTDFPRGVTWKRYNALFGEMA